MSYPKIEKPTEPGWYWFRWGWRDPWQPAQVYKPSGCRSLYVHIPAVLTDPIRHVRGEWRGPIPTPETTP